MRDVTVGLSRYPGRLEGVLGFRRISELRSDAALPEKLRGAMRLPCGVAKT